MYLSEDGRVEATAADCGEPPPPPDGCTGPCTLCTLGCPDGACYWWCACGDHKVLVDSYGNTVGESRPSAARVSPANAIGRVFRLEDVDAARLIKTTTASLEPVGQWMAVERGTTRTVSGMAKSPTGQQYTLVFEVEGPKDNPSVKSSRIYRQEVALVIRRVAPGAVK
jgi:hypothetical protein